MIKLIVALGPNNLIGMGNKMPWHVSEEFKHFKATTMDSWLFMGENTFKGLPGKLPGRKICVISPSDILDADKQVKNTNEAIEFLSKFKDSDQDIYIAGGKSVYEGFYKYADELIISKVNIKEPKGDVFLSLDLDDYQKKLIKTNDKFKVFKYTKGEKNEN